MQILRQITGCDGIEVVVVAVNPVDARAERLVASGFIGDVTDTQPERNLWMARGDLSCGPERAVDVAESADDAGSEDPAYLVV